MGGSPQAEWKCLHSRDLIRFCTFVVLLLLREVSQFKPRFASSVSLQRYHSHWIQKSQSDHVVQGHAQNYSENSAHCTTSIMEKRN